MGSENTIDLKSKKTMLILTTLFLSCFFIFGLAGNSQAATSVTQYGITWTFNKDYTVGQFVNGDYYIIDPGDGVIISSISPTPSITTNGTMVNPIVDGYQCLDSRSEQYSSTVCASFPLMVHAKDSVLSSISVGGGGITTDWAGGSIDSHTFVAAASILTIMSAVPPTGSFRPAYTDRSQTLYNISNLDTSKLPKKPLVGSLPHNISYYERGLERPWIMFGTNWQARSTHAVQNMFEYHREISNFLSDVTLIMMTDTVGMDTMIMRFCQLGIDAYHIGIAGIGDSAYYVPPTLYTGILLNNDAMKNLFISGSLKSEPRDYPDFYYWSDHKSTIHSSIVPEGQTWSGYNVFFRNQIGNGEHEHLHPSEWDNPTALDHWKNESYREGIDSHTQVGMVLSALMMGNGAKQLWNHNATFDYIDRWMNKDWATECAVKKQANAAVNCDSAPPRGNNQFVNTMWDTYRASYNDVVNDATPPGAPTGLSVL